MHRSSVTQQRCLWQPPTCRHVCPRALHQPINQLHVWLQASLCRAVGCAAHPAAHPAAATVSGLQHGQACWVGGPCGCLPHNRPGHPCCHTVPLVPPSCRQPVVALAAPPASAPRVVGQPLCAGASTHHKPLLHCEAPACLGTFSGKHHREDSLIAFTTVHVQSLNNHSLWCEGVALAGAGSPGS